MSTTQFPANYLVDYVRYYQPGASAGTKPAITSAATASDTAGKAFSYTILTTGTAPITCTATNLPTGVTLSSNVISGTPADSTHKTIVVIARNSYGSDTLNLAFVVYPAAPIAKPAITSNLTASATVGQPFSYAISATGPGTITYGATNLPAGLVFSGNTISGTPADTAHQSVSISATNGGGTTSKTLVITIVKPVTTVLVQPAGERKSSPMSVSVESGSSSVLVSFQSTGRDVRVDIFDLGGRLVASRRLVNADHLVWDAAGMPQGQYLIKAVVDGVVESAAVTLGN